MHRNIEPPNRGEYYTLRCGEIMKNSVFLFVHCFKHCVYIYKRRSHLFWNIKMLFSVEEIVYKIKVKSQFLQWGKCGLSVFLFVFLWKKYFRRFPSPGLYSWSEDASLDTYIGLQWSFWVLWQYGYFFLKEKRWECLLYV